MIEKWLSLCLVMTFSLSMAGQTVLTSSTILTTARQDRAVTLQEDQLNFISNTNQNLPFAEQISLRTETDRFRLDRQEYLARLNVNGLKEMQQQREWQQATFINKSNKVKIYLHEALRERYEIITSYYFSERQLGLEQEMKLVYDDRLLVMKKLASLNAGAEVDEMIKTEFDRDKIELDIVQATSKMDAIKFTIKSWIADNDGDWVLDTTAFVDIDKMQEVINQLPESIAFNPRVIEKESYLHVIQSEYDLQKANSTQMLDFFQVRYTGRQEDPLRNELSFGIGLTIPYRGSSIPKMSELQIEKYNADLSLQLYQEQLLKLVSESKFQISELKMQYDHIEEQWNNSQARFTLEQSGNNYAEGPLTLLKAKEVQIDRQLMMLDIEKEMIDRYLKILDLTGAISAIPSINYLSKSLESY